MRTFTFSPAVLDAIRHERYHHPHPRVQRKMDVLWLKSRRLTHREIAAIADVSPRSVQRWVAGERLPAPERWAAIHALAVERGEELAHLLEELAARK